MVRQLTLLTCCLALSSTAIATVPSDSSNCSNLIKNTPELGVHDLTLKLPGTFPLTFSKDQYETKKAFDTRVSVLRRKHEEESATMMARAALPVFRMTADPLARYNAERGGYEALSPIVSASARKDGTQHKLPTITAHVSSEVVNIGLGAKLEKVRHHGLAIKSSDLKSPVANGRQHSFFVKMPTEKARSVGKDLAFVVVGISTSPWVFSTYTATTDVESPLTELQLWTYLGAVKLLCAALVDKRSYEILHEFK